VISGFPNSAGHFFLLRVPTNCFFLVTVSYNLYYYTLGGQAMGGAIKMSQKMQVKII